jgi:hypothetical protein
LASENAQSIQEVAEEALERESTINTLIENLSGPSRLLRQSSAASLAYVAKKQPEKLIDHTSAFVDALNRPEARTRWEALDILTILVEHESRTCDKAIAGAESSLFDEESGPLRLSAMRFLCRLGATTTNRSERIWPLIDEGIQCYHGDVEFPEMLGAITEFSEGKLSKSVKGEIVSRMAFDAENSKGTLKRRAQHIIDNVS